MPDEPARYKTTNGQPPNGGVPPNRMFATVAGPPPVIGPPAYQPNDPGPPNGGMPPSGNSIWSPPPTYAPPPVYAPERQSSNSSISCSFGPSFPPAAAAPPPLPPPPPPPPAHSSSTSFSWSMSPFFPQPAAAAPPPPPPNISSTPFEPPGQWVSDQYLQGRGWSYLAPAEHTTIHFVSDGLRPCDFPNGYYPHEFRFSRHKVPCIMTVKELCARLGCPSEPGQETWGITEMIQLGDNRWAAGSSFAQNGDEAKKTLGEVGWTARRGDEYPVWLVCKRS